MARKNGERIGRKAANSCAMRAVETCRDTSLGERETFRGTSPIKKQNISKLVSIITLKQTNDLFTIIMVYFVKDVPVACCYLFIIIAPSSELGLERCV